MGRSGVKFTATIDELEAAIIKRRGNFTAVAKLFGVNRRTIERRVKKSVRLQEATREAREEFNDFVEWKFHELIERSDWRAIRFHLVTQMRDRGYIEQLPQVTSHTDLQALKLLLQAFEVDASLDEIINQLIDIQNQQK